MKKAIHGMFERAGYRVVRITARPEMHGVARSGGGHGGGARPVFFPSETDSDGCRPWPIPADLAANTADWARVLAELYKKPASWPACVSPETGLLIHALVRNIRPRVVIETGTCHGASTIWIAAALGLNGGEGVVHTFDDFRDPDDPALAARPLYRNRERQVRRRFRECGLNDRIVVHKGDSAAGIAEATEQLARAGGVQMAFIDGDHSAKGVHRDWAAAEPLLNVGGYLLLHDMWPDICNWDGPRWLADNIHEVSSGRYEACDVYTSPLNYGLCVLRKVA